MPVLIPPQSDIAARYLEKVSNQQQGADVNIDSDNSVRANATASAIWGLYQFASWVLRQSFPDTADPEWLRMHAATRGLTPKHATPASGTATLSGARDTRVPSGLQFRVPGNPTLYQTTAGGSIDASGKLTVRAVALQPGTEGNVAAGTSARLTSAPAGVDSIITLTSMNGGTDAETDDELLTRLLNVLRQPPAGGNANDYKVWAESVDGVATAWVYPLRRGLGTVDVVITAHNGLPSAETLAAVQRHIDAVRPVTAKSCLVLAPTVITVDISVQVGISDGVTLEAVSAAITHRLTAYFNALIPGQAAIRTQIGALISDVFGVLDYRVITPKTNTEPRVSASVIEWVRAGKITVRPLRE